jgi:hypothetical protein
MVVAVDAEDVAAQLLGERAGLDAEDLGQLATWEGRGAAAQEQLGRLAVEHERSQRRGGQPALLAQLRHPGMEPGTAQRRIGVVEHREVELGDQRHAAASYRLGRRPGGVRLASGREGSGPWISSTSARCG